MLEPYQTSLLLFQKQNSTVYPVMLIDQFGHLHPPPPPLHWLGMSIINYKTGTSRLLLGVCCAHGLWNEKKKKNKM